MRYLKEKLTSACVVAEKSNSIEMYDSPENESFWKLNFLIRVL